MMTAIQRRRWRRARRQLRDRADHALWRTRERAKRRRAGLRELAKDIGRLFLIAIVVAALAAILGGCVHMRAPSQRYAAAPPDPQCDALDGRVMGLNLTTIIAGAAGSGAATAAPIFDAPEVKYSLAIGAGVLSLTGAITGYLQGVYAARYAQRCPH